MIDRMFHPLRGVSSQDDEESSRYSYSDPALLRGARTDHPTESKYFPASNSRDLALTITKSISLQPESVEKSKTIGGTTGEEDSLQYFFPP
ncbi:MAG: hypothetical protein H6616_17060 [Ignavibacteria bacterium]|nr:hypothetical protein [Ignavibacteria bacterium]